MKKLFLSILMITSILFVGCTDLDDVNERLDDHDNRLNAIESLINDANNEITSIKALLDAQSKKISIVSYKELDDKSGYELIMSDGSKITLKNGKEGTTPLVNVKMHTDGHLYWTIDGEFMRDADGNMIKADGQDGQDGITPNLRVNTDGFWEVSLDNGKTWQLMLDVNGDPISAKGSDATVDLEITETDEAIIIIYDGQTYTIPKNSDDPIVPEVITEEVFVFDALGGAKTITIYANCEWELVSKVDWASFSMESGSGDAEIVVTLTENVSVNKREGVVEIRYEGGSFPFTVTQEGFEAIVLNEKGSANSYLVNSGDGLYAIEAVYKGNSKTDKIDEWSFASLLWQDENGLITEIRTNSEEHLILIDVADKAGNAVLAVHDQEGVILWSWHLWVTDFNPEATEFTTPEEYANGTKWVFMDRHLGATDYTPGSIEALGLIYQWGRKDPFTASGAFTEQNRELYDIDGNSLDDFETTASKNGSLKLSIQNPNIFYLVSYETGDWCDESNDNFWGGISMQKTIYDPCPVGWKVPISDESGNTPYGFLNRNNTEWVNNGRLYTGTDWWLAASGTRVLETGEVHIDAFGDAYGGIWTGTHGKANPDPEYPALYGQYMYVGSGRLVSVNKDSRSQGMSVRCVRE